LCLQLLLIGITPLMAAAQNGHSEMLGLLQSCGMRGMNTRQRATVLNAAHPENGGTAFHCACHWNHIHCAEVLARSGALSGDSLTDPLTIKDKSGLSGQQVAQKRGHHELAALDEAVASFSCRPVFIVYEEPPTK
jgi:ankyrin repeat protein